MSDPVIAGAVNFRDVGGLAAEGGTTRHGVLYRAGNLARLDDEGVAALRSLGIRLIVDLRDDEEVIHAPSRIEGLELEVRRVPLFLGSVASFFADDLSLDEMYRRLVWDSADRIVTTIRAVAGGATTLVHCTVGKDRTGVAVAIALSAAGVDREAVIADYARTEGLLPEWRNVQVVERLRRLHPEAVHLEDLAVRSPAPVMRRLLAAVDARHGSPAGYLRDHGMSADEIAVLQSGLVG
ncbi:tyrosine-protein phosphatase [Microbacterium sp. X-17]|uniref:tyrosine-protein phosphatase n=1 Tax=Microbacterium sp. X-17 TaxID=3144404 RepID=UPI0031F48E72